MKKILLSLFFSASIFAAKAPTAEELSQKSLDAFGYGVDNGLKNIALASFPYIPEKSIKLAKMRLKALGVTAEQVPPHVTELEKDPSLLKKATKQVLDNHSKLIDTADMKCVAK